MILPSSDMSMLIFKNDVTDTIQANIDLYTRNINAKDTAECYDHLYPELILEKSHRVPNHDFPFLRTQAHLETGWDGRPSGYRGGSLEAK